MVMCQGTWKVLGEQAYNVDGFESAFIAHAGPHMILLGDQSLHNLKISCENPEICTTAKIKISGKMQLVCYDMGMVTPFLIPCSCQAQTQ